MVRRRIKLEYMATITLRVADELDAALERRSNAAGVSKSDLARQALRGFSWYPGFSDCVPNWSDGPG